MKDCMINDKEITGFLYDRLESDQVTIREKFLYENENSICFENDLVFEKPRYKIIAMFF
jgi:hypothetical protein